MGKLFFDCLLDFSERIKRVIDGIERAHVTLFLCHVLLDVIFLVRFVAASVTLVPLDLEMNAL